MLLGIQQPSRQTRILLSCPCTILSPPFIHPRDTGRALCAGLKEFRAFRGLSVNQALLEKRKILIKLQRAPLPLISSRFIFLWI